MKIRRLEISRFRGIRELTWDVTGSFVCLIGPGDSTKTTVLDAIEFAIAPHWSVHFDDSDFYNADVEQPISITVTIGELPDELKSDAKYGLSVRAWAPDGTIHDEPDEGDELVLSVRLLVDRSLDPAWAVINDRDPEGRTIGWRDREKFGCVRLGAYLDRHFAWGRGSILSRITDEADSISEVLADVNRVARQQLSDARDEKLRRLQEVADEVRRIGADFGVAPTSGYRPHLDLQAVSIGVGAVSLHDGEVPLRRAGTGSRRLLAAAMQRRSSRSGGITLIDEVEYGLEPHRVRNLLRVLRSTGEDSHGHVIATTHAPTTLQELRAEELHVVRSVNGVTTIVQVPVALQPNVQKATEAFLARKVIVCEGKTELGLMRGLDNYWTHEGDRFGLTGVALADGRGSEAPSIAHGFLELGYQVALLGDSDRLLDPTPEVLERAGGAVFQWAEGLALEQRLVIDLPWVGVSDLVRLAMREWGVEGVRDAVGSRLDGFEGSLDEDPTVWPGGISEDELRTAIGAAAKDHRSGWFKRVDLAEEVAAIVIEHFHQVEDRDLGRKLLAVREWAHRGA